MSHNQIQSFINNYEITSPKTHLNDITFDSLDDEERDCPQILNNDSFLQSNDSFMSSDYRADSVPTK
jgi:hypothetical protein